MDILFQACPCPFSSLRTVDFNSEICRFVSLVPATDSGSELSMVRQVDFDILIGHTISNDIYLCQIQEDLDCSTCRSLW